MRTSFGMAFKQTLTGRPSYYQGAEGTGATLSGILRTGRLLAINSGGRKSPTGLHEPPI